MSTLKTLWVQDQLFSQFQKGKDLEVRISCDFTQSISAQDILVFRCRSSQILRRVKNIRRYVSFEAMVATERPERIWPRHSAAEVLDGLRRLYHRTADSGGVIVFELEIVA